MGSSANRRPKQRKLKVGGRKPFKSSPAADAHMQQRRRRLNNIPEPSPTAEKTKDKS